MLILICNDQGQGYNAERLKTHIVFKVTQDHKVDSNIWSDDKYPDKYNLTQTEIDNCPQLSVSINTDDLGIFDTSLENEFALMAAALEKMKRNRPANHIFPSDFSAVNLHA
jgi:hypothetical protein